MNKRQRQERFESTGTVSGFDSGIEITIIPADTVNIGVVESSSFVFSVQKHRTAQVGTPVVCKISGAVHELRFSKVRIEKSTEPECASVEARRRNSGTREVEPVQFQTFQVEMVLLESDADSPFAGQPARVIEQFLKRFFRNLPKLLSFNFANLLPPRSSFTRHHTAALTGLGQAESNYRNYFK